MMICLVSLAYSSGDQRIVDLRGHWKFNIGDDMRWADPDFDDSKWGTIFVPAAWEDEGFNGYNGPAWYRKTFTINPDQKSSNLYIYLGYIDDVDEVYLNGHFIGFSGAFPPHYFTAYNLERRYRLPAEYIYTDRPNQLAVRVYDHELGGGILRGHIGIYENNRIIVPDIDLEGIWKFRLGDDMDYLEPDLDDSNWKSINVPAPWEIQGYKDYDGIAWYRKSVYIPASLRDKHLILLMGVIDDLDETFVNGKWVGATGKIGMGWGDIDVTNEWEQLRVYELDNDILTFAGQNLIAVRVYDKYVQGGIYRGPVGIVRYDKYKSWIDEHAGSRKGKKSLLDRLFDF
jgi:sialate O-acetylesterase